MDIEPPTTELTSDKVVIKVDGVSKVFKLPHEKNSSIKGAVVNFYRRNKSFELQKALEGISLEIKEGEFFGIVGRNGSGKSTLLKMLAGIYLPSTGTIQVNGRLTPFIELGVGFNPELTGRENVFLNGALLGFNRREMLAMYSSIVKFAELERFMDQKLKNYSSGMQVRLAFAIAIRAKTDILLIDEVLAVGDAIFQKKCYDYFKKLKKDKKTVVFVSHDTAALQEYCDRGVLIDSGHVIKEGNIGDITRGYIDLLNAEETKQEPTKITSEKRWGTGDVQVTSTEVLGKNNRKKTIFTDQDKNIKIKVSFSAKKPIDSPVFGVTINDAAGESIFASNTLWSEYKTDDLKSGDKVNVVWEIPNIFNSGTFYISPAAADRVGAVIYDWRSDITSFKVRKLKHTNAYTNVNHSINIS